MLLTICRQRRQVGVQIRNRATKIAAMPLPITRCCRRRCCLLLLLILDGGLVICPRISKDVIVVIGRLEGLANTAIMLAIIGAAPCPTGSGFAISAALLVLELPLESDAMLLQQRLTFSALQLLLAAACTQWWAGQQIRAGEAQCCLMRKPAMIKSERRFYCAPPGTCSLLQNHFPTPCLLLHRCKLMPQPHRPPSPCSVM